MIVCVCRRVSDRQIRAAAENGAETLDDLQQQLGVAMQCGKCSAMALQILNQAHDEAMAALYYPAA